MLLLLSMSEIIYAKAPIREAVFDLKFKFINPPSAEALEEINDENPPNDWLTAPKIYMGTSIS